ncbi:MAG: (2Fe-2S)-binding protein [Gammaproteobacteria bacterium]|nr:(2Fe-2S)-binding protein [Gammaproteobacteria bacterium]
MSYRIRINGSVHDVDAEGDMPLLWVLRDILGLTDTKFGCGMAQCGACTVHADGVPVRSCTLTLDGVGDRAITTIQGIAANEIGRRLQAEWLARDVPQCGYCQGGQILAATALLTSNPRPSEAEIDAAMAGNLCRCYTYPRIRAAIREVSRSLPLREKSP